jgi:hypothetical protein
MKKFIELRQQVNEGHETEAECSNYGLGSKKFRFKRKE